MARHSVHKYRITKRDIGDNNRYHLYRRDGGYVGGYLTIEEATQFILHKENRVAELPEDDEDREGFFSDIKNNGTTNYYVVSLQKMGFILLGKIKEYLTETPLETILDDNKNTTIWCSKILRVTKKTNGVSFDYEHIAAWKRVPHQKGNGEWCKADKIGRYEDICEWSKFLLTNTLN